MCLVYWKNFESGSTCCCYLMDCLIWVRGGVKGCVADPDQFKADPDP